MLVLEFLAKNKTVMMPQPLYSPDLAPTIGVFLFPKLKTPMKGKHFARIENIKDKSKQEYLQYQKASFRSILRSEKTLA